MVGGISAAAQGTSIWAGIGAGIVSGAISGAAAGFTFGTGAVAAVGLGIIGPGASTFVINATYAALAVASSAVGSGTGNAVNGESFGEGAIWGAGVAVLTLGIGATPAGKKIAEVISKTKVGSILNKVGHWVSSSYDDFYNATYAVKVDIKATPGFVITQTKQGEFGLEVEGVFVNGKYRSVDSLLKSAQVPDKNGLTRAGYLMQKHGDRGLSFPNIKGGPSQLNPAGLSFVESSLKNVTSIYSVNNKGELLIFNQNGLGLKYSSDGSLHSFRDPLFGGN